MKALSTSFIAKGFAYAQVHREGNVAIYIKIKGRYVGYEVIVVRSHTGYKIAGKHIPPAEVYPSDEQWGQKGFTCATLPDAMRRLKSLVKQPNAT